jgi:hypothetical protein
MWQSSICTLCYQMKWRSLESISVSRRIGLSLNASIFSITGPNKKRQENFCFDLSLHFNQNQK